MALQSHGVALRTFTTTTEQKNTKQRCTMYLISQALRALFPFSTFITAVAAVVVRAAVVVIATVVVIGIVGGGVGGVCFLRRRLRFFLRLM
jgi:hypothetical protein